MQPHQWRDRCRADEAVKYHRYTMVARCKRRAEDCCQFASADCGGGLERVVQDISMQFHRHLNRRCLAAKAGIVDTCAASDPLIDATEQRIDPIAPGRTGAVR